MQCPGQDSRYWSGEDVFESNCPNCGQAVEFFKDDSQRTCKACGHRVLNPKMDFGCAAYCPHAQQCLGSLPSEGVARQGELLRERIATAMRHYFGTDARRIAHAEAVAKQAEAIGQQVNGDMMVIMAAAYLHDIGIREAERKFTSSAPEYQQSEGPPVAEKILLDVQAQPELIEEVCDIIGHHHAPREEETNNFKVLYDADLIVNTLERYQESAPTAEQFTQLLASFMTKAGEEQARIMLEKYIA